MKINSFEKNIYKNMIICNIILSTKKYKTICKQKTIYYPEEIHMSEKITRRKAFAVSTAGAGMLIGATCLSPHKKETATVNKDFLSPWSPPEGLVRDLTPGSIPIRLAAFTDKYMINYPTNEGITEVIKRIKSAGYTATNISGPKDRKNPWLTTSDVEVSELKTALKEYDIDLFDVHAYFNNIHPDESIRKESWRWTVEQCEVAERLGCRMVTTHTGSRSPVSAVTIHKDNWTMETWKLSVQAIKQILKDTAGMKVALGIEALNLINVNNPRAHLRLKEEIGDPRLKVCLDPTNMINLGTYFRTTELINECFDLLGEDILACHAKDTYVLPNKMSAYLTQILPGKGQMDYKTYLVRLSRMKWPRTLAIEHLKEEDYPDAKAFIEETAAKVGVIIYS